jgi:hypothetical protein
MRLHDAPGHDAVGMSVVARHPLVHASALVLPGVAVFSIG